MSGRGARGAGAHGARATSPCPSRAVRTTWPTPSSPSSCSLSASLRPAPPRWRRCDTRDSTCDDGDVTPCPRPAARPSPAGTTGSCHPVLSKHGATEVYAHARSQLLGRARHAEREQFPHRRPCHCTAPPSRPRGDPPARLWGPQCPALGFPSSTRVGVWTVATSELQGNSADRFGSSDQSLRHICGHMCGHRGRL